MALRPSDFLYRLVDQDFGRCITTEDLILPLFNSYCPNYFRPWRWHAQTSTDKGSIINNETDKFQVTLDVQQFKPNEINVRVANGEIIIEGRHEERQDEHGFISRQFTRRYTLPKDCAPEDVTSNLSVDGILIVTANKKIIETTNRNERVVPIQFCQAAISQNGLSSEKVECEGKSGVNIRKSDEIKKKEPQAMPKEDHSRLLKPEFMTTKTGSETTIGSVSCSNTADKAGQCSKLTAGVKLGKTAASKSEEIASKISEKMDQCTMKQKSSETAAKGDQTTSKITESANQSSIASKIDKIVSDMSAISEIASSSAKKGDMIGEFSMSQFMENVGESSISAMSEMSRMSTKTSEIMKSEEVSSSFISSLSSSVTESNEMTSEVLNKIISAELKEAAENL